MIKSKQIRKPQCVLVVDDQEVNRDLLGLILGNDYEVIYAENGLEGLHRIRENIDRLSVILLDLMMPVMDGFSLLAEVRGDEEMDRIPVIVLTADKSAELRALQMGAADFITKPFDLPEVILARVSRIIELNDGRQLISAAEKDRLTGLYSRNFFFEYAARIHQYHPEWHMDAVVVDIDHFHSVNELNGRDFGDRVLGVIGSEIRSFLSETDGIAGRLEADAFVIFCRQQADYRAVLERFQQGIRGAFRNANIILRMGVKPWQEDEDPLLRFDRARTACSIVRGGFKTHLMIYDDELQRRELFDQRLLNDLHRAVEERQLEVYYQPKFDIQCDPPRLASAEALIRWNHPELGMIRPGDFIPLFESSGQISTVDNYVWNEAARQIACWRDKHGVIIPVSVNVSRVDVCDPDLEDRLNSLIEANGLDHKCLKLEVTESACADDSNHLVEVINRLREHGFEIEMDDFGSGYSSLNSLSSMPIDILKMDMKFIRNIEKNEKDLRLVELVLDIAKYLNVPVVAEGVETEKQLELLRGANCDLVQGYYFSRPVPPDDFEKMIVDEKGREAPR